MAAVATVAVGGGMWGQAGLLRLFGAENGGQVAWLLPAALALLVAVLALTWRAARTDRTRAAFILWGGWLVVTGLTFSLMAGIFHAYYNVAMAPAIGAVVGMGSVLMWRRRDLVGTVVLAVTVAGTAIWSSVLLGRSADFQSWLRPVVVIAGLAAAVGLVLVRLLSGRLSTVPLRRPRRHHGRARRGHLRGPRRPGRVRGVTPPRRRTADPSRRPDLPWPAHEVARAVPAVRAVLAVRSGPGGRAVLAARRSAGLAAGRHGRSGRHGRLPRWRSASPAGHRAGHRTGTGQGGALQGGGMPGGGMGGLLDATTPSAELVQVLQADASKYRWVAAAIGANNAAGYQLGTGESVMPIGGFNGSDPSPTLAQFQQYVSSGQIHYFIGGSGFRSNGGSQASSEISAWVQAHFTATTVGATTLYDLTKQAN